VSTVSYRLLLKVARNKAIQNHPTSPDAVRTLLRVTLTSVFTLITVMAFSEEDKRYLFHLLFYYEFAAVNKNNNKK